MKNKLLIPLIVVSLSGLMVGGSIGCVLISKQIGTIQHGVQILNPYDGEVLDYYTTFIVFKGNSTICVWNPNSRYLFDYAWYINDDCHAWNSFFVWSNDHDMIMVSNEMDFAFEHVFSWYTGEGYNTIKLETAILDDTNGTLLSSASDTHTWKKDMTSPTETVTVTGGSRIGLIVFVFGTVIALTLVVLRRKRN